MVATHCLCGRLLDEDEAKRWNPQKCGIGEACGACGHPALYLAWAPDAEFVDWWDFCPSACECPCHDSWRTISKDSTIRDVRPPRPIPEEIAS